MLVFNLLNRICFDLQLSILLHQFYFLRFDLLVKLVDFPLLVGLELRHVLLKITLQVFDSIDFFVLGI